MSDARQVAATVRLARSKVATALARMNTADGYVEEAVAAVGEAVHGSSDTEVAALPGIYSQVRTGVEHVIGILRQVDVTIGEYLRTLGVPADPAPSSAGPPLRPPGSTAQESEPARVTALRAELPPPVQPGAGQKTHGRWLGAGGSGEAVAVVSGNDSHAKEAAQYLKEIGITRPLAIAAHVETKVAVQMAKAGIVNATLLVNHVPCKGPQL